MFEWLNRFKPCGKRFWRHTWRAWYTIGEDCQCERGCFNCDIKQKAERHLWDDGDCVGVMMELRALYPEGYIEPRCRYTCRACGATWTKILCDR